MIPALVERDRELAELEELLAAVRRGGTRVALIEGPAGIGKTALLDRARARAADLNVTVLAARGGELERNFGFGLVLQLLEPVLARARPDERRTLTAGAAALAEPVFATARDDTSPGGDSPDAVLHGLYWLIANLADRSPVLLAIDDAHWADEPSLRFLIYLARRLEGLPVAIALAVRSGEPAGRPELLEVLKGESSPLVLRPPPLSEAGVEAVVAARFAEPASVEFCRTCHTATRGNAFLLTALLDELWREGRRPDELGAAAVTKLASERIAAAVLLRIGRLGRSALALARAVAVLGERADHGTAAALADLCRAEATSQSDSLSEAGVLAPGPRLQFVHPIVRTAIYEDIPDGQRAALHERAADLFAETGGEPETVALHLLATEPARDASVVDALRDAARAALSRGAPETASRYLRRALAEPPPEAQAARVLFELGSAGVLAGEPAAADLLAEALEQTTDRSLRAEIALELGAQVLYEGRMLDLAELLERELDALDDTEPELAVPLEAELLIAGVTAGSARQLVRERFPRARARLGTLSPAGARLLLPCLAVDLATTGGTADEVAELAGQSLAYGPFGMERAEWALSGIAIHSLVMTGRLGEAEHAASDAVAAARTRGSAYALSLACALRAFARLRLGALEEAEADAATSLELAGAIGSGVFHPWARAILVSILLERGQLPAARAVLGAETAAAEPPQEPSFLDQYLHESSALLLLQEGHIEAALTELRVCERFEADYAGRPIVVPVSWRSRAALAQFALGARDEARRLACEDVDTARRFGAPRPIGVALRALALVEGGDRGVDLLVEAVSVLEGSEGRLEHGRALIDLGAALRRSGRRAEARERLAEGMEIAHRCGAAALVEQALAELRVAGARPRRAARSGRESLTASELRICEMAADGMTNPEIAQALFVTLRTVEMHLSNAYRKLGIATRRDLGGVLRERRQ